MGTLVVLAVVIFIAGLAVRSIYRDKKSGKSCAGCPGCGGCCDNSHEPGNSDAPTESCSCGCAVTERK